MTASDLFGLFEALPEAQRERWMALRAFAERRIRPGADEAWLAGRSQPGLAAAFGEVADDLLFPGGFAWPPPDPLFAGLVKLELGRVDASSASFYGVHVGLAMACIQVFGSEDQRGRWIGPMARFEQVGSFSLSEPDAGSDVARGLACMARREGDSWVLDGAKKWSGNAPIADVHVIFARTPEEGVVHGFLVERDAPGMTVTRIEDKISKRGVDNALVTLDSCRVPESGRLPGVGRFSDVARALAIGRSAVAFEALGIAMGAYESALAYAQEREQFGKPIAAYQLVQDKLVRMLAEITSMQCLCFRLAEISADGEPAAALPALSKVVCGGGMRRVVALAREVLGGNGILLEHGVARHFADAEAVYSYEGTQDINTLIVGRHITGYSSFVS